MKQLFRQISARAKPAAVAFVTTQVRKRLMGYLRDITPEAALVLIETNKPPWVLLPEVERDSLAHQVKAWRHQILALDSQDVGEWLAKERPDLWSVIDNHEMGAEWLEMCLADLRRAAEGGGPSPQKMPG